MTTTRALVPGLSHIYLPGNHLDWWDARPPGTGAVQAFQQERYRALLREFHARIATVIGDATQPNDLVDPFARIDEAGFETPGAGLARLESYPMQRAPWPAGDNAAQPSAEFRVRHAVSDGSPPRISRVRFTIDTADQRRVVTSADRHAIWVDFVTPQRAVGLQCGFAGPRSRSLAAASFRLDAWRGDGGLVATATGADLQPNDWRPRETDLLLLRDDRADIRTIRYSCIDPAFAVEDFLYLYRVWHEALPASVVCQGTIANVPLATFRGHQNAAHPDLPPAPGRGRPEPEGNPIRTEPVQRVAGGRFGQGAIELDLPFGCDRATVFLRGFKVIPGVEAADRREPRPQKFSRLRVILTPTQQDRRIRFALDGEYVWGELNKERSDALIAAYWTVLAWRADRAELFASGASANAVGHRRKSPHAFDLPNRQPAADPARVAEAGPDAVYGPLAAGLSSYSLRLPRPVEPQTFDFAVGFYGSTFPPDAYFEDGSAPPWDRLFTLAATGGSLATLALVEGIKAVWDNRVTPIVPPSGPLSHAPDGRRIGWSFVTNLDGTIDRGERADTSVAGTVLSGRSVTISTGALGVGGGAGRDTVRVLAIDRQTRSRSQAAAPFGTGTFEVSLPAEQVLTVLGAFMVKPEDEVRELDVEVRGLHHDGETLMVGMGAGLEISGASEGLRSARDALPLPYLVGINRATPASRVVLATGSAAFDDVPNTVDSWPQTPGFLRHDGNLPIGLRSLQPAGASQRAFALRLRHRGVERPLAEFAAALPPTLMPGETIEVVGRFRSADAVRQASTGRSIMSLVFAFTDAHPPVTITVFAQRRRVGTGGFLFPARVNFGRVAVPPGPFVIGGDPIVLGGPVRAPLPAYAVTRPFSVQNFSTEPLVVMAMTLARPTRELTFRMVRFPWNVGGLSSEPPALHVLEPGTNLDYALTWAPRAVGPLATQLTVATSAGPLVLEIIGEAMPQT